MFCGNCGAQIPDDADFCPNCGAVVNQNIEQMNFEPTAESSNGNSHGRNKKLLVLGVCCAVAVLAAVVVCAAVFVKTLSGSGSDSSVSASSDNTRTEEKSADDGDTNSDDDEAFGIDNEGSKQKAEASEKETVGNTVAVSDEAYIERLEAYQEYYDSIKDENENYEVLATISLNEDNLPMLWLLYADKDKLMKTVSYRYIYINGYIQLCDYQKKEVVVMAETPKFSADDGIMVIALDTVFGLYFRFDETVTWYDEDTQEFIEPIDIFYGDLWDVRPDIYACFDPRAGARRGAYQVIYGWDGETVDHIVYYGSASLGNIDYYVDAGISQDVLESWPQDMFEHKYYWWDGSLLTTDKECAILTSWLNDEFIGRENIGNITFKDSYDFNILIEDLIEQPSYDIHTIAVKSSIYNNLYDIEYADLNDVDELFEEAMDHYCEKMDMSYDEAIEYLNQRGFNLE